LNERKKGHTVYGVILKLHIKMATPIALKKVQLFLNLVLTSTIYCVIVVSTKETQTSPPGTRKETNHDEEICYY